MKKLFLLLLFVVSTGTIAITYQWLAFSEDSMDKKAAFTSSVVITVRGEELHVKQTFLQYRGGTYHLEFPKKAKNISCNEAACGESRAIDFKEEAPVIRFDLPLKEKSASWAARVGEETNAFEVTLRDTSYMNRSFTMVSSPDASVRKERLHYYKWNNISAEEPLYMFHTKEKQRYANEKLTILHERDKLLDPAFVETATSFTTEYGPYLLFLDEQENSFTEHSLSLRNRDPETLEELLFRKKAAEKTSDKDHWVNEMYAALLFETSMDRAEQLAGPLSRTLTPQEISEIKDQFLDMEAGKNPVSFSDKMLSGLREGETHYTKMIDTQSEARFYYLVPRVSDDGGEFQFVEYRNRTYIPLEALKEDGLFEVTMVGEDSFLLKTKEKRIRLTLDSETFVQNESSFGIAEGAVERFEKRLYIKETFLNDVLHLYPGTPSS